MTHFILMVLCVQFNGIYLMRLKASLPPCPLGV